MKAIHAVADLHTIHKRVAKALQQVKGLPLEDETITYNDVRTLNDYLRELNEFFKQVYICDDRYQPPVFLRVDPEGFGPKRFGLAKKFFWETIKGLHQILETLPATYICIDGIYYTQREALEISSPLIIERI